MLEYYWGVKKMNSILAENMGGLEVIMLSKINQAQKHEYYMILRSSWIQIISAPCSLRSEDLKTAEPKTVP